MKYIKSYKLFESVSDSEFSDIKSDLEYILLEAEDLGYKTRFDWFGSIRLYPMPSERPTIDIDRNGYKEYKFQIDTSISVKSYIKYLNINEISDCIDRIIHYMRSKGKFENPNIYIKFDNEGEIGNKKVDLVQLYNDFYDVFEVKLKFKVRE
jgi:hypothetical protein